jgi:hypothetical protein
MAITINSLGSTSTRESTWLNSTVAPEAATTGEMLKENYIEGATGTGTLAEDIRATRIDAMEQDPIMPGYNEAGIGERVGDRIARDTIAGKVEPGSIASIPYAGAMALGAAKDYVIDALNSDTDRAPLSQEEWKSSEFYREGIKYEDGMTAGTAAIRADRYDDQMRLATVMRDASTSQTVLGFGAALAGGIFEPKNLVSGVVAAGIVRTPLVGMSNSSARYSAMKNFLTTKMSPGKAEVAARGIRGGTEGFIAAAITEPSNMESAHTLNEDYTMTDSLFNLATSVAFSGAIEAGGGFIQVNRANAEIAKNRIDQRDATLKKWSDLGVKVSDDFVKGIHDKDIPPQDMERIFKGETVKGVRLEGDALSLAQKITPEAHAESVELATQQLINGRRVDMTPTLNEVTGAQDRTRGYIAAKEVAEPLVIDLKKLGFGDTDAAASVAPVEAYLRTGLDQDFDADTAASVTNALRNSTVISGQVGEGDYFQSQPGHYDLPGFYSKMYRSLDQKLNASGTPAQFKQQVEAFAKGGQFKQDELYWSGLPEYLDSLPKDQKVNKAEVLEWLDKNKLEIREEILDENSEPGGFTEDDVDIDYYAERVNVEEDDPNYFESEVESQIEMIYDDFGTKDAETYAVDNEDSPYLTRTEEEDDLVSYEWDEDAIRSAAEENARQYFSDYADEYKDANVGNGAHTFRMQWNDEFGTWSLTDEDSGRLIDSGNSRRPEDAANEALWEHLRDNEIIRYRDDDNPGSTKYGEYQLEGEKTGYTEMLITLPQIRDEGVRQHGWDANDPVMMHIRFNSRESADGKKVLFVEEVQSDWHQQGRERGYKTDYTARYERERDRLMQKYHLGSLARALEQATPEEKAAFDELTNKALAEQENENRGNLVAQAPFADLNKYSELGMKRMISWAVENGYDEIAWTTGAQQAERYSGALQRNVKEIRLSPDSTAEAIKVKVIGNYRGDVTDFISQQVKGATLENGYVTLNPQQASEVFGKGIAEDLFGRASKLSREEIASRKAELEENIKWAAEQMDTARAEADEVFKSKDFLGFDNISEARGAVIRNDDWATRWDIEGANNFEPIDKWRKAYDLYHSLRKQLDESVDEVIDGLDITINDKGMREVYDKVLVNVANGIVKKFDAKVAVKKVATGEMKRELLEKLPSADDILAKEKVIATARASAGVSPELEPRARWHGEYDWPENWSWAQELDYYTIRNIADTLRGLLEAKATDIDKRIANTFKSSDDAARIFGISNRVAESTDQWGFAITDKMRESVSKEGFPLFQKEKGSIEFNHATKGAVIRLFKTADKSTFLHESGHLFLHLEGIVSKAKNLPEARKADQKVLLDWLGAESFDKITTPQHEQFARGFEAYLREGKAPSLSLRNAFERFKEWLTKLYQSIAGLNVTLSPEVRGAFDRMLATTQEIQEARPVNIGEKVTAINDTLNGAKSSMTYDEEAMRKVEELNALYPQGYDDMALEREIDEVGMDVEALRNAGVLSSDLQEYIDMVNDSMLDGEEYNKAIKSAAFCLTRG